MTVTAAHLPRSRRAGILVARAAVAVTTIYLGWVAATVLESDPDGQVVAFWWAAVVAGAVYHVRPRSHAARTAWLVLMTACALGRALTLALVGTDYLTRGQEIAAALSWAVVWLCSILAALVLTADRLLNEGK